MVELAAAEGHPEFPRYRFRRWIPRPHNSLQDRAFLEPLGARCCCSDHLGCVPVAPGRLLQAVVHVPGGSGVRTSADPAGAEIFAAKSANRPVAETDRRP